MEIASSVKTPLSQTNVKSQKNRIFLLLSFGIPMLFLAVGLVLQNVHPFGDQQILVVDFWHQYYPFLRLLHEKLQHGGSLLYTWDSGLGSNFVSIFAYYLASPLNLLTALVPETFLRDAVTLVLLLKVGFAGLFFACFLRGTFRRNDFSLCIFSVMYALCSYILGYYWNIIWLDTVALLPLVVLGLVYLVRDGKCRLYCIALGLSLFTNFYIGMFTCIFAVIAYCCLCVCYLRWKQLPMRTLAMAGCSLLGGALAAIVLIPTYYALQLTYSVNNAFPTAVQFYENWRTLAANLISFHEPTSKDGLPNLACGVLPLVLIGPFLCSGRIRIREKIMAVLVLAFLMISCNCNVLNYIWHGFHFPNMLPYRFSFLFSFALLTVGYRAFLVVLEEKCRVWDLLAMLAVTVGVFLIAYNVQENRAVYWTAALMLLYTGIMLLAYRQIFGKKMLYLAVSIVLAFEMFQNVKLGTETVSTSAYTGYPASYTDVENLLEQIDEQDETPFYRTELSTWYTLNDPALYGYHGVSQFSSMANENATKWIRSLGFPASEAGNRYYYGGGTPVGNAFTGVRYLISRASTVLDDSAWEQIASSESCYAYRNQYDLPIGFRANAALLEYDPNPEANPFDNLNTLFRLATGIETPLFTMLEVDSVDYEGADALKNSYGNYTYHTDASAESHSLQYNYRVPLDTTLYGYMNLQDVSNITILQNGVYKGYFNNGKQGFIFPMGTYQGADTASVSMTLPKDAVSGLIVLYMYQINPDVLEQGFAALQNGGITLTEASDTKLNGTLTAEQDGVCYFSIPYESGWHAKVDGVKTEITPIAGEMVAVPVTAGTHTITLTYCPKGFIAGACCTAGAVLLLLAVSFVQWKTGKRLLQPVPEEQAEFAVPEKEKAEETES